MRILSALLILAATLSARAQGTSQPLDALFPFSLSSDSYTASNRTVGWTFEVTTTMSVFQLGFFNAVLQLQNGPMTVGLWSSAGALLASTNISTSNVLTNGANYQNIPTVELLAGQTYSIGAFFTNDFSVNVLYDTNYTAGVGINSTNIYWAENTSGFGLPTTQVGNRIVPGGATFRYTVPEPAVTALLALSGLALFHRSRKIRS